MPISRLIERWGVTQGEPVVFVAQTRYFLPYLTSEHFGLAALSERAGEEVTVVREYDYRTLRHRRRIDGSATFSYAAGKLQVTPCDLDNWRLQLFWRASSKELFPRCAEMLELLDPIYDRWWPHTEASIARYRLHTLLTTVLNEGFQN